MSNTGSSPKQWTNWSQNIVHNQPSDGANYYFRPTNLAELKAIVADAVQKGLKIKVSGQRHSQPPLVTNDNRGAVSAAPEAYLIDLSCYADLGPNGDQNMVVDVANKKVTVNSGVREDALDALLTKNNLIMNTVTAGGFFSAGGMTAVDVHGATVQAPIFAETASSYTVLGADGNVTTIDASSPDVDGVSQLQCIRVSLGSLGIVTSITIDVLDRPYATSLIPSRTKFPSGTSSKSELKKAFVDKYQKLLTEHDRVESFFNPYIGKFGGDFLALIWDLDDDPSDKVPNTNGSPTTACVLSEENKFGADYFGKFEEATAEAAALAAQEFSWNTLAVPINIAAFSQIESEVDAANKRYSDLWLSEAARVIFMSYFVPLPKIDAAGLEKVWEGFEVVSDWVGTDGNFHTAAPMEFRFIKGGDSVLSGCYAADPDTIFINYDLIGFVEKEDNNTPGLKYSKKLLDFFAHVERKWVSMGGLPHNGKMYGFYDPIDSDTSSSTDPFNPNFLSYITGKRSSDRGAPIDGFKKYRESRDPNGVFYSDYLKALLGT